MRQARRNVKRAIRRERCFSAARPFDWRAPVPRTHSLYAALLAGVLLLGENAPAVALLHDQEPTGAGEWTTFEGGQARLFAVRGANDASAVLEVELKPGWKTYWLAPGPSGIPPQFDAGGSENVALRGVGYPAPNTFNDVYGTSVGYQNDVAFPIALELPEPGAEAVLALDATIGVCAELCVPVSLRFSAPLVGSDLVAQDRIERARIGLPATGTPIAAEVHEGVLNVATGVPKDAQLYVAPPEGTTLGDPVREADGFTAKLTRGDGSGEWSVVLRRGSGPLARETEHELRIAQ